MTPSTNGNILGRDQLDWASLLYVDQVWYDENTSTGTPLRSFINPNDVPMFVFLQAEFIGGYSRISTNDFSVRYKSAVAPILEAGAVGYNLVATVYAYLFPGESFTIEAAREQQVPVNYTVSVSQRTIDPSIYEGTAVADAIQSGSSNVPVVVPAVSQLVSWRGIGTASDRLGVGSKLSTVEGVEYNPTTGSVRNVSSPFRSVLLNYHVTNGTNSFAFVSAGQSDGNLNYDNFSRATFWISFNQGEEFTLYYPTVASQENSLLFHAATFGTRYG